MGITIHKILEKAEQYSVVELTHGSEQLVAKVWNEYDSLKDKIGEENLIVEMNYDQLVGIKLIEDFNDFDSSITSRGGNYVIKGRVSQTIKTESDCLIDLYLQTGPEFISILKSEIGDLELKEEQGVEVELTDLKFFPTNN